MAIKATGTDSTDTSSKDTGCSLSESPDEEQTTKIECKSISVKEEEIGDNGDSSMKDIVKSLLPNQAFQGY